MLSESAEAMPLRGRAGRQRPDLDERRLKRLKYLWEETTTPAKDIAGSIGISRETIDLLVKDCTLKPRRGTAMMTEREEELVGILTASAKANQICPTNSEIAKRMGIGLMSVQAWFPRLVKLGVIKTEKVVFTNGRGASHHRIVTITVSGLKTRKPDVNDAWYSRKPSEAEAALDKAKTFVRSRGPTVYNASVLRYGAMGIYVDRRLLSVDEFILLALQMGFVAR